MKRNSVRVLHAKAVAFVKFERRANAEFAKEAMECQALDDDEVCSPFS